MRFLIFRDGESYFGVALEFNVIVEAASPEEAFLFLNEASFGYLEAARKVKLRPRVLNQKTDPEYEKMWQEYQGRKLKEKYEQVISKLPIFSAGWLEMTKV